MVFPGGSERERERERETRNERRLGTTGISMREE